MTKRQHLEIELEYVSLLETSLELFDELAEESSRLKLKTHLSHDALKNQMDTLIEELKNLRDRMK